MPSPDNEEKPSSKEMEMETESEKAPAVTTEKVELKRELGLFGAMSIYIGIIIGSGIFISPKGVLRATGSVGLCLLTWGLAGIVQLGSTLCYAELGAMIPAAGGAYTYLRMGIGNPLAFAYMLQGILVVTPSTLVIVLLTFAKYLVTLLPTCGSPDYLEKFIAAAALITIAVCNTYSTKLGAYVSIITTIGKLTALAVIIVGGIVIMAQGTTNELGSGFSGTSNDPTSLALALYSASFSYMGGENLNILVEEIKNPGKTLPRAAILGMLIVIVVYILTNVSYLAVMTRAELLGAEAVAVVFGDRVLGVAASLIPVAVMVSTFGAANNTVFSGSRVAYAAARDGNAPDVLSYIQINQYTPICSMVVTVTMSLILLVPGDPGMLINYIGFLGSFYQIFIFASFIRFRLWTMKDAVRPIKIPLIIPFFMLLLNIYKFVAPIAITPQLQYIYVAAGVFGGAALVYIPFVHFKLSLPFFDKLVTGLQLTWHVCPPTKAVGTSDKEE